MGIWYVIGGMIKFASEYCMEKCVRTMIIGMLVLPLIFLIRKCNRTGRAAINFYAMLLLIPAAFTGMNRLLFLRYISVVPALIYSLVKPIHGLFYFCVMAVLMARFLWKNRKLGKQVRALPLWEDEEELQRAVGLVLGQNGRYGGGMCWSGHDSGTDWNEHVSETDVDRHNRGVWQKHSVRNMLDGRRYLRRVKVYVTQETVSPFSGGLLHPYVVMPVKILAEWPREERRAVLCHELVHIREGHVFWTVCFSLLKIYWWGNPVIYLCDRLFREDMELACDEQCVREAGVSRGAYGRALVNMAAFLQGIRPEATLCFVGRNDFQNMRKRIEKLAALAGASEETVRRKRRTVVFAGVFAGMMALVTATSYPKYTRLDELSMYDEDLNLLDYNSEELRDAVYVLEGRLVIDEELFGELLAQKTFEGDYVYVSFDTIMKVPGSGGCGNTGMIAVADYSDIFYLSAKCLENDIAVFWLKYLV